MRVGTGAMAEQLQKGPQRYSYGHREIPPSERCKRDGNCASEACKMQKAKACKAGKCGLCCDAEWWAALKAGETPPECRKHRPRHKPMTLGGCLQDAFEAQIDDPVASLKEWVNDPDGGDLLVHGNIAEAYGMIWEDAGKDPPQMGTEMRNKHLGAALAKKAEKMGPGGGWLRFSKEELDELDAGNVKGGSYVRVGDRYFKQIAEEAVVKAVLWFDGGRSGGHDVLEWCLVLADDPGAVFGKTVSLLTRSTFQRCTTLKGKCNADGIAKTVGPLLRIITDLGMYGIPHERCGCARRMLMLESMTL